MPVTMESNLTSLGIAPTQILRQVFNAKFDEAAPKISVTDHDTINKLNDFATYVYEVDLFNATIRQASAVVEIGDDGFIIQDLDEAYENAVGILKDEECLLQKGFDEAVNTCINIIELLDEIIAGNTTQQTTTAIEYEDEY